MQLLTKITFLQQLLFRLTHMSKFAESQTLFSNYAGPLKLKKNLSIETSFSSKRGLSLVSQRSQSKGKSTYRSSFENLSQIQQSNNNKINFFGCSINSCKIDKLTQSEQIIQLKQKKKYSSNLRQRNANILTKDVLSCFNSTNNSYGTSKVESLWNIDSPINKIM